MLRFAPNVSILFRELPFLDRIDEAARLGFGAIEFWWPAGQDLDAVVRRVRENGLEVALINFDAGEMPAGDRGLLNDPERAGRLRENVPVALELARRVGCTRMNALAGKWRPGEEREAQLDRVRENLAWIAGEARGAGVTVLLEALNAWENGPYLFTGTRDTLAFIDSVGAPNLAYQFDVYHMQRMEGNVVATIREYIGRIGHIQVADSPDRHEPGTGELRYGYVFDAIEASGYDGWIGLEYNPTKSTAESFHWLPGDRRGSISPGSLRL